MSLFHRAAMDDDETARLNNLDVPEEKNLKIEPIPNRKPEMKNGTEPRIFFLKTIPNSV
jgi:hypothetical protein